MNIAIIGSNGFIGRHLTEALISDPEHKLFLFGRSLTSFFSDRLPYTKIDLNDNNEIVKHFPNIDVIYYLASESIPSTTWEKPLLEIELNLIPFIRFMENIVKLSIKKIAFVSSAGTIYGPSHEKVTEDSVKNPFSPYGITKLTIEHFLHYYKRKHNINYDIYRVSNVYGIGQDTSRGLGIINTFLENIISHGHIRIFGNGENIRNYIYIRDVAELLKYSVIGNSDVCNTFNLASDDALSINELVNVIRNVVSEKFEIIYDETRVSDNSAIRLNNDRIMKAFPGYKLTRIEDGIRETYLNLKEQVRKEHDRKK